MTSNKRRISMGPWLLTAAVLTACAHQPAPVLTLSLTGADRTPAVDAPAPDPGPIGPPLETGAAERARLTTVMIQPMMAFSLSQEATIAAERQRAAGVIAKVDAYNAEMTREARPPARKRRWWPFGR